MMYNITTVKTYLIILKRINYKSSRPINKIKKKCLEPHYFKLCRTQYIYSLSVIAFG